MGQGRVELPTSRLSGVRSNHLSYWPGGPVEGGLGPWKLNRTRSMRGFDPKSSSKSEAELAGLVRATEESP